MTRILYLFAAAFALGTCSVGCRTVPTQVPVKELIEAQEAAKDAASGAESVANQAESLSDSLAGLAVPEPIKEQAKALAVSSRAVAEISATVPEELSAVAPTVEKIAGERDAARIEKDSAEKLSARLFLALLISALIIGFLIMLLLRRFLPG